MHTTLQSLSKALHKDLTTKHTINQSSIYQLCAFIQSLSKLDVPEYKVFPLILQELDQRFRDEAKVSQEKNLPVSIA